MVRSCQITDLRFGVIGSERTDCGPLLFKNINAQSTCYHSHNIHRKKMLNHFDLRHMATDNCFVSLPPVAPNNERPKNGLRGTRA